MHNIVPFRFNITYYNQVNIKYKISINFIVAIKASLL